MKKSAILLFVLLNVALHVNAQSQDSIVIRKLYTEALTNGKCYGWLNDLCRKIGGRISGSPQAEQAVIWSKQIMDSLGLDTVYLQEVMVPHWVRGDKEVAKIIDSKNKTEKEVPVCALGGSVETGVDGISAGVVEVHRFEELAKLGKSVIGGKIVFFNRPMDPSYIISGYAYGEAVDQRSRGAIEAAKFGAVGVIVRSMTLARDDNPHTGAMHYADSLKKIPAAAISTNGADLLSKMLKADPQVKFFLKMNCKTLPDVKSHNVIGEIRGIEKPGEIVLVGGHLDAWDNGQGAHDDGTGCVQSIEIVRLFKILGIRPKRTVRAVLFMNEENGLRGARKYAEIAKQKNEKHIAAIESDGGGFTPRGFTIEASGDTLQRIVKWKSLFTPYLADRILQGWSGADVSVLKDQGTVTMDFSTDNQRYFDLHHTAIDTFDKVHKRELELGAATMAAMVYLLSEYGIF